MCKKKLFSVGELLRAQIAIRSPLHLSTVKSPAQFGRAGNFIIYFAATTHADRGLDISAPDFPLHCAPLNGTGVASTGSHQSVTLWLACMNSHPLSLSDAIPRHIIFETKPQYCHPVALRATDAAATLTRALHTLRAAESRGDKSLPVEREI
jgi:hypothetical protein